MNYMPKMSVRVTPDTMLEKERKTRSHSFSLRLTEVDQRFRTSQNKGFKLNQGSYVVCPSVAVPTEEDNSCDLFAANCRLPKKITALENSLTTPVMTSAVVQSSGPSRCASGKKTVNLFALPRSDPFGEPCSSPPVSSRTTAQWTTCRELEYTVDGHSDEGKAGDTKNDTSGWERTSSRKGIEKETQKTGTKKRPLLLPPIMLPPIYTVKPKPMRLREQMFSQTPTSRNLQTISDDEWAKLRDCRYLRLRFNKEAAVKV